MKTPATNLQKNNAGEALTQVYQANYPVKKQFQEVALSSRKARSQHPPGLHNKIFVKIAEYMDGYPAGIS